ncbi:MAG: MFS transporter [Desulfurococcaceae archaeon]
MMQVAATFHAVAWGMYYAFTRIYVVKDLGGGVKALTLLTGLEWFAALLAIPAGYLADRYGGKWPLYIGALGAIPFLVAPLVVEPTILSLVLSASSLAWAVAWPTVLSHVLRGENVGVRYSKFGLGIGLGWGLGSTASGFIYERLGVTGTFTLIAALYLMAYMAFINRVAGVQNFARVTKEDLSEMMKALKLFVSAIAISTFAREYVFIYLTAKLNQAVSSINFPGLSTHEAFGIIYGVASSMLAIPVRLLAGKLVSKVNPLNLLAVMNLVYIAYASTFYFSNDLLIVVLWQIPLYPLVDVAMYTSAALYSPGKLRSSASGAVITFSSIGAAFITLLYPVLSQLCFLTALSISSTALMTSSALMMAFKNFIQRSKN